MHALPCMSCPCCPNHAVVHDLTMLQQRCSYVAICSHTAPTIHPLWCHIVIGSPATAMLQAASKRHAAWRAGPQSMYAQTTVACCSPSRRPRCSPPSFPLLAELSRRGAGAAGEGPHSYGAPQPQNHGTLYQCNVMYEAPTTALLQPWDTVPMFIVSLSQPPEETTLRCVQPLH